MKRKIGDKMYDEMYGEMYNKMYKARARQLAAHHYFSSVEVYDCWFEWKSDWIKKYVKYKLTEVQNELR